MDTHPMRAGVFYAAGGGGNWSPPWRPSPDLSSGSKFTSTAFPLEFERNSGRGETRRASLCPAGPAIRGPRTRAK